MLTLDEMLLKARQGAVVDAIARQFDLSRDQTIAAIEALTPAFSAGLRRATSSEDGQRAFLDALGGGRHAAYLEDFARLFSAAGVADGNAILGRIFGTPEVSRAIAEHAAAVTAIQTDVLKRMMPAVAALLMGGLAHEAKKPEPSNPFAAMVEAMMQAGAQGSRSPASPEPTSGATAGDLFGGDLIGEFLKNLARHREQAGKPKQERADPSAELFAAGHRIQQEYAKGIEAIFERFLPQKR